MLVGAGVAWLVVIEMSVLDPQRVALTYAITPLLCGRPTRREKQIPGREHLFRVVNLGGMLQIWQFGGL